MPWSKEGLAVTQLDAPFSEAAWTASLSSGGASARTPVQFGFEPFVGLLVHIRSQCPHCRSELERIELEYLPLNEPHQRCTDVGRVGVGDEALFDGIVDPETSHACWQADHVSFSVIHFSLQKRTNETVADRVFEWLEEVRDVGHRPREEGPLTLETLRERCEGRMRLSGGNISQFLHREDPVVDFALDIAALEVGVAHSSA